MHVKVTSNMARLAREAGDERFPTHEWEGEVPIETNSKGEPIVAQTEWPYTKRADFVQVNEILFRFFNRVDEGDGERLEQLGYRLPSLSVGDVVAWGGRRYLVEVVGFVEVDAEGRRLTPPSWPTGRGRDYVIRDGKPVNPYDTREELEL
jgi:hypothetical protein